MKNQEKAGLLRLKEVQEIVGFKSNFIYAGISAGTFPAPLKIGKRASRWHESDVYKWVETQKRETFLWKTKKF